MGACLLPWFVCLIGLLITTDARTDADRRKSARNIITNHLHKPHSARAWTRSEITDDYIRYVCTQEYCSEEDSGCWQMSLHVHTLKHKKFDKIYAWENRQGKPFMGAHERMGTWPDYDLVLQEHLERPECKHFCHQYEFTQKDTVILVQKTNGLTLRVHPDRNGDVNSYGQMGKNAQWEIQPRNGGKEVMLKSLKTGKYLRLKDSRTVDVAGHGGHLCPFKVHRNGDYVRFENVKFRGKYLAVNHNGVRVGGGGDYCWFQILKTA